jgi:hypothetical protein
VVFLLRNLRYLSGACHTPVIRYAHASQFDIGLILTLKPAIPSKPNGGNHTALFAEAAGTEKAHNLTMAVTKALAHTGFRVIDDDQYFAKVSATELII